MLLLGTCGTAIYVQKWGIILGCVTECRTEELQVQ